MRFPAQTLGFLLSFLPTVAVALTHKGVDWSSLLVSESAGRSFQDVNGQTRPLEQILASNGVNTVRQRVWVGAGSTYNLDYNLRLARRAKAAGMNVYLTLHFSDSWADPGQQTIPAGWPRDIDNLSWRLYNYTMEVGNAFAGAGVTPSIVSIGNEIRAGLLWPTGDYNNFYNMARLLHSASSGIRDSRLGRAPKIMVHLDNGWNWDTQKWFYESLLKQGPFVPGDFDQMGVSFYPFYGPDATFANLKTSLTNMANTWGKEIIVAETNWPTSCPSPQYQFPADVRSIPFSADGQTQFFRRVAKIVSGVRNGNGLFVWEPAWIDNQALGSSCQSNTMFAWPGKALSSLSVFKSM
ncbi:arabinogalactan endo-1,4-beta-galactosidase [Pyricularia oryzae 70-15]|uniref:Arabinogalactan endo-beta-1,4-galactanase n=1 Tax=Pyricularia oryzae (strain 70-15 / ATCC MYA-4617 / FGSC 8958) TaxID=242507 RepID=G4NAG9_PYRO7|nr:arabinogalactan endo-1,4-beta-galactosidase [Pyricularia oryzae 70-15]EHA51307.1 arabinogalactan endo-1,4-beta-galactosidase [Pyricularia oryzae 70-15]